MSFWMSKEAMTEAMSDPMADLKRSSSTTSRSGTRTSTLISINTGEDDHPLAARRAESNSSHDEGRSYCSSTISTLNTNQHTKAAVCKETDRGNDAFEDTPPKSDVLHATLPNLLANSMFHATSGVQTPSYISYTLYAAKPRVPKPGPGKYRARFKELFGSDAGPDSTPDLPPIPTPIDMIISSDRTSDLPPIPTNDVVPKPTQQSQTNIDGSRTRKAPGKFLKRAASAIWGRKPWKASG